VSLFIDPEEEQVRAAHELQVSTVEFHTGAFAAATNMLTRDQELGKLRRAARLAKERGLKVAAGHGLHYENTKTLIKTVPEIGELNIGHAIVARAILVGLENAVREMKELLK
jgi:pyridoxine 5-phosphate synthase